MTIKLLIADDEEVICLGIAAVLAGTDIQIIGHAKNSSDALEMAFDLKPDVVLMDIRMPEGDGLTTLGRIKMDCPGMPVVIYTGFDNPTWISRALALGASAFLLKSSDSKNLVSTIQAAAAGENAWSPEMLRRVTSTIPAPRTASHLEVPLTHREVDVLELVVEGLTNKEIAKQLDISYETVKEHVHHILQKVGVTDRTQAAVWAIRQGLVK